MEKKKCSVLDFKRFKQEGIRFTETICYDYTMASMVDETSTEMILVGDSLGNIVTGYGGTVPVTMEEMIHHIKAVVKGAPHTFIVGDMPFGTYNASDEQAVINASRLMKEGGCDCIKLEGGVDMATRIRAIVKAGIPVIGHIGLTPQTAGALGGMKLQGKDSEYADRLVQDAQAVEAAGAFAIVLECMPTAVAHKITATLQIPTISTGAGRYCDCQSVNFYDITGLFGDFKPKFVKQYASARAILVKAVEDFHTETVDGSYPTSETSYNAVPEGYEEWR